jgi:tRNA G18 (ribose-2'-O)-methylase SpoU
MGAKTNWRLEVLLESSFHSTETILDQFETASWNAQDVTTRTNTLATIGFFALTRNLLATRKARRCSLGEELSQKGLSGLTDTSFLLPCELATTRPMHVQPIDSLDLPELAPYRTLRRPLEHREQGIFVAEGEKVVCRLLESDLRVISLLLPEKWFRELEPLIRSRREEIPVYLADKPLLEKLTGFSMYQGVLAVGKVPPPNTLEQVLRKSARPILFAAVDGLANAENLGALVRNCAAFSVQALIVGETSSSPFLRRAVRNSMGTIFSLPVVEAGNLVQTLRELRGHNVRCIAAHPRAQRRTVSQASFAGDCCLVFGSEGPGISGPVLQVCDEAVAIPMAADVDSLNVASASAAFLYEAARQRGRS